MKKKLLGVLLIGAAAICGAFAISGCSKNNENETQTPAQPEQPAHTVHNYGEWIIEEQPTCGKQGRKYHTCQHEGCNHSEWENISVTPHDYKVKSTSETEHTLKCTVCKDVKTEEHKLNACIICNPVVDFYYNSDTQTYSIKSLWSNEGQDTVTEVIIPSTYNGFPVTEIGWGAFRGCSALTDVTIPSSITNIENGAFGDCNSLTSIVIPSSVTYIGAGFFEGNAFGGCTSLESILVDEKNSVYKSENNCLLTKDGKTLVCGCKNSIIPNSVTSIGQFAFDGCSSLTAITIPNSVTSIGDSAFGGCSSITSITIPSSVTSIGDYAFGGCSSLVSICVTNIEQWAFNGCNKLTNIYYSDSAEDWESISIGPNACLTSATRYYYSETEPTEAGNYWHYDTDGVTPVVW